MKFKPNGKRLLVSQPEKEKVSSAGIILPDSQDVHDVKNWIAEVIEVGNECNDLIKSSKFVIIDPTYEYPMFLDVTTKRYAMIINQDQVLSSIELK